MKKFRDILETVYPPKSGDEKNFMDKHIVDKKDNPNAAPGQFTSDKKKAKRVADYDEGDDEKVYEAAELHTKRADKEAVVVRAVDPKTGQSKARVVKRSTGEIKIGEEVELDEKAVNPYAVGMAAAMKQAGDTPPLKKSTIVKGHEIAKSIKKEAMDPVGKHDADIDNDGDTDKSDKYLIKRRRAIARAVNEAVEVRHDRYMRSHGKKARDSGEGSSSWMFTHKGMGDVDYKNKKEVHTAQGKFADAKKSAQQWAKEHGHSSVYVMEEVELDEETMPGNIGLRMVDSHEKAAAHHKKNGNMKGYAAHLDVADRIKNAVERAGPNMPIRSTQIEKASDKAFSNHPHRVVRSEEIGQIDELSQDTLNNYHSKAGADRLKAKATVQKTMDMKKPAASTVDKATSAFSRFQKRGKGMTAAANKMSEENDLDEGHGVFLKGGSVGETRSGKPVEVHSNVEDAKAQAKRLNKHLSPGEKKHYGLKYHVKPVAEGFVVVDLDEVSKATLGSYIKKASHDVATKAAATGRYGERANKEADVRKKTGDMSNYRQGREDDKMADKSFTKSWKRREGIAKATDRLTKEEVNQIDEAFKVGKMDLKDGSSVNLTKDCVESLNSLFSQLNPSNKTKMEQRMKSSKTGYNEILSFAKEVI